ncbi:MAG: imidazole glycerol phosphate synthase subunit HisF [Candidatus Micrarchaeota archaeon]
MLAKRIIACLDVKEGRVVKGTRFIKLMDAGDPVKLAERYAEEGADEIVFLDISASQENRSTRLDWVRKAALRLNVPFTVGGGISSIADIRALLVAGADKIAINTSAYRCPTLIWQASNEFGSQCVVVSIDAKRVQIGWQCYSMGGKQPEPWTPVKWARQVERLGAGEILLTSIDSDGSRTGFDLELTRLVARATGIPVIASGGAGSGQDFLDVFAKGLADAALAAGIFHYGVLTIGQVKNFLADNGVAVRT